MGAGQISAGDTVVESLHPRASERLEKPPGRLDPEISIQRHSLLRSLQQLPVWREREYFSPSMNGLWSGLGVLSI